MKIESVGIYNNRGLLPGKANPEISRKAAETTKIIKSGELKSQQKVTSSIKPEVFSQLSSAESTQIKKLFGQFDLTTLSQEGRLSPSNSKKVSNIDERPGRFIDIIV